MFEISKQFRWEMGHRISQHKGQCFNLHGHSYMAEIYLSANVLNKEGMVVDFAELGKVMKPLIDCWDHAFMVWYKDDVLVSIFQAHSALGLKTVYVDFEATAENMARYIYQYCRIGSLPVSKVIVWETSKCKAEYSE